MNEFDKLFSDLFGELGVYSPRILSQPPRVNSVIQQGIFPPSNILVDTKTKELTIEVALAGYSEDNILLSFDTDSLVLTVDKTKKETEEEEPVVRTIQRGIKMPDHAELKWNCDPRYYDRETVQAKFKDGLLTITVKPRTEVAPKKINVFGKLNLEDKSKQIEAAE